MEKRALIAFVLALLIILYYPFYVKWIKPPAPAIKTEANTSTIKNTPVSAAVPAPVQTPKTSAIAAHRPAVSEKEVMTKTPLMEVVFSSYNGSIKQLFLLKYLNRSRNPVELVKPIPDFSCRPLALINVSPNVPIIYDIQKNGYQCIFKAIANNLKITKIFTLDPNSYLIHISIKIENKGQKEFRLPQGYAISVGTLFPGHESRSKMYMASKSLVDAKFINDKLHRSSFQTTHLGRIFWSSVKNKYFALILKPDSPGTMVTVKDYPLDKKTRGITNRISMPELILPAGSAYNENFLLYAGPKKYGILKKLGADMDAIMDFGILAPISKVVLYILNFFYGIIHNYGIAIILLTILIRFLLYPLTIKSYKSMSEMHKLQPYMQELQKKYKGDPKRIQKETMLLYKEHKVNPFGGCLPMLLQMPILIALFTTLRSAIELRNAPFMLWIKDLSEPDMLFRLSNGFSINILPLLMTATFFIQQKITAAPAASAQQQQQQKLMATIMPLFMGFIFYNMPSGLVLYFTLSTLFGIWDQYRIQKKAG